MRGRERKRLAVGAVTFLAAAALALGTPSQPRAASADCGDNAGSVCWENESCLDILFYEQCTTEYKYYKLSDGDGWGGGGGGGGSLGGDDEDYPVFDDPGCGQWGDDYLGWGITC
jgi:hypothetical protein